MKTKNLLFMIGLISLFGVIESKAQTGNHFDRTETTVTTTEVNNTFVGVDSGLNNTSNSNSGFGTSALMNATGGFNCAFGSGALAANLGGNYNCAFGSAALGKNTIGTHNMAMGHLTLGENISGEENTAIGYASGPWLTTGSGNTSLGFYSARSLTTGSNNTLIGRETGMFLTTGSNNTFLGRVGFPNQPATADTAGNDTSGTIILADSNPSSGGGNQRLYIHGNGYTGIGLGNNTIPKNRLELGGGKANTSGLRFRSYTNTNISPLTAAATPKVLSVNGDGDVVLVDDTEGNDWHLTGNTGTNPAINFLGTIDNKDLVFRRNNIRSGLLGSTNTSFGSDALTATTTSTNNTAIGANALMRTTTGGWNTAVGQNSLINNTTGANNTAVGNEALVNLIGGSANVGIGRQSGNNITGGNGNVIIGNSAGPTVAEGGVISSKLYIDNIQNFGAGRNTPLIFGDFASQDLIFNVAINSSSRVTINSGGTNSSGLRFTDLNNTSTSLPNTIQNNVRKVLSVNGNLGGGDVILVNDVNIYDEDGTLTGNRTVNMADKKMIFDTQAQGRIYIGDTNQTNPFIVGAGNNFPPVSVPESDYRLLVEGGILTEKVKIALRHSGTDWADYVFANDYKLMPLKEVENFVKANKHLPGISSANDLVKNGLDVADMQAKQMGKIEELTLYIIKQDKAIEELKAQVKALTEKSK
jgi:hypothetical protein